MVSLKAYHIRYNMKGSEEGLHERICWIEAHTLGYGTTASFASLRLFFHTKWVSIGAPPTELDEQLAGRRECYLYRVFIAKLVHNMVV